MHKSVSDYLNTACSGIHSEKRQQNVRSELSGHFAEAIDAYQKNGLSEREAALQVCTRMGDAEEVGRTLAAANRQIPSIAIFFAGCVIIIATLILTMMVSGNAFLIFADIQSLLTVIGIAAGLALMGGIIGMTKELLFSRMVKTALYGGGIGFLMNVITLFHNTQMQPKDLIGSLGVCMLSVLYGLLTSGVSLSAYWLVRTIKPKDARDVLGLRGTADKNLDTQPANKKATGD